jgi:dihydrofolate reductase
VVEDPGGAESFERGGWAFQFERGADGDRFKLDEVMASDALLLGRVTYEGFAVAWPSMTEAGDFAVRMNGYPKYVVSTTLDKAEWNNSHIIKGNVPQEVATLKQQPGRNILVYGSGQLVQMLIEHDLVDEFRLMVYPIVLGSGKRLFKDGTNTTLKPTGTHAFSSGVVALTYQPAGKEATK